MLACSSSTPNGSSNHDSTSNDAGAASASNAGASASPNASGGSVDLGLGGDGSNVAGSSGESGSLGGSTSGDAGASATTGAGGNSTAVGGETGTAVGGQTGTAGAGGGSQDPNPTAGEAGATEDPPPGDTSDPPPGDTGDPPPGDTGDPPPGDTGDPPPGDTGDPPPGDTGDPPSECVPSELEKINVIVFKDAEPNGADVEGRMYVGGNATFSGYGIANKDPYMPADCSEYALVVGGDLTLNGGSVGSGKIAYGGAYIPGSGAFNPPCGIWHETPVDFPTLEATLTGYSIAFAQYPQNGQVTYANGSLSLVGTDLELNVFYVTAEQLNSNIFISAPDSSSVIVNVSGTDVIWQGVGFTLPDGASCRGGTSDWCHRILYNLYEAQTLTVSGVGVQGSVLAPYATMTADSGGGNIDGQLIVEYLYGGIEYHPYFFTGCLMLPW